jgi:hypothetical protein
MYVFGDRRTWLMRCRLRRLLERTARDEVVDKQSLSLKTILDATIGENQSLFNDEVRSRRACACRPRPGCAPTWPRPLTPAHVPPGVEAVRGADQDWADAAVSRLAAARLDPLPATCGCSPAPCMSSREGRGGRLISPNLGMHIGEPPVIRASSHCAQRPVLDV